MAHKLIIVAFEPEFTTEFKHWVAQNVTYAMEAEDESTKQYELDAIETELADASDKQDRELFTDDAPLMALLKSQDVEYVEF